ncbi:PLD nuclease N-terminal domain-containing protein [Geodermatophilus sp. SYSU D01186]
MPLLDIFWTMFLFFCWVLWFWLLFRVYADLFSRHDIGGGAKTGWVLFTILLPFLGVFVYLISQGRSMAERSERAIERQREATDAYIRSVAADAVPRQRATAQDLLDSGAVTREEYDRMVPQQPR